MIDKRITSKRRAFLRSQAQELSPVVMVGRDGITESVINALDEALDCHELVKVKFQDFKDETKDLSTELEKQTDSLLVAVTGFTAVFFRQKEESNFQNSLRKL